MSTSSPLHIGIRARYRQPTPLQPTAVLVKPPKPTVATPNFLGKILGAVSQTFPSLWSKQLPEVVLVQLIEMREDACPLIIETRPLEEAPLRERLLKWMHSREWVEIFAKDSKEKYACQILGVHSYEGRDQVVISQGPNQWSRFPLDNLITVRGR